MALTFPNPSRTYDFVRNAVRFVGHDGMLEIRFFVVAEVLARAFPNGTQMTEFSCLTAFDGMRRTVQNVAQKAYSRHRQSIITLTAEDFG